VTYFEQTALGLPMAQRLVDAAERINAPGVQETNGRFDLRSEQAPVCALSRPGLTVAPVGGRRPNRWATSLTR
jgi:hypothetical protein